MNQPKNQLSILRQLNIMITQSPADPQLAIGPQHAEAEPSRNNIISHLPTDPTLFQKLTRLKALIATLQNQTRKRDTPTESPEPNLTLLNDLNGTDLEPPLDTLPLQFDVKVIFQSIYELYINELVKSHIKLIRKSRKIVFNCPDIVTQLTKITTMVHKKDNFYTLPITLISKIFEEFHTILKKINQIAADIFLDNILPIENEIAISTPPTPAAASPITEATVPSSPTHPTNSPLTNPDPGDLKASKTLTKEIKILTLTALTPITKKEEPPLTPEPTADIDLYTSISYSGSHNYRPSCSYNHQPNPENGPQSQLYSGNSPFPESFQSAH